MAKRYIQTVTFYTYGDTPEEAFNDGQKVCDQINEQDGSAASIIKMYQNKWGSLDRKEIDITKLKSM